jgi:hypothetical protein
MSASSAAAERHLFTIERNLHSQQLATQKDQRRP